MGETKATLAPDPIVGMTIGNYQVRLKLGEGGMGAVYLAEHPGIGKRVALKVLHSEFASRAEIVGRFFNEAKAVNDIQHPNIVDIIDFGQMPGPDGRPLVYFIMELIAGGALSELIKREAPLDPTRARHIGMQVADALAASHKQGIVHRDLKPDNVMLVTRGRERDFVKLLDFGIAKLTGDKSTSQHRTRTGIVMGTPQYMSPEQCEGRGQIDHRTDVYALGILLYEMLTGKVPFSGEGYGEILVGHMTMPPAAPSSVVPGLPPSVELVVLKALEKKPDNRFPTMESMMQALADPDAFVAAHGGANGFLRAAVTREMDAGFSWPQAPTTPPLTPAMGRPAPATPVPTTLGGSAAELEVPVRTSSNRRLGLFAAIGVLIVGAGIGTAVILSQQGSDEPAAGPIPIANPQPQPQGSAPTPTPTPTPTPPPVEPTPTPVPPVVAPKVVTVKIDSKPSGAAITIGGEKKGTTPYTGELPLTSNLVEVKLTLDGYEVKAEMVQPDEPIAKVYELDRKRKKRPAASSSPSSGKDDTKNPFDRLKKDPP